MFLTHADVGIEHHISSQREKRKENEDTANIARDTAWIDMFAFGSIAIWAACWIWDSFLGLSKEENHVIRKNVSNITPLSTKIISLG